MANEEEDEETSNLGVGRYPCMPSLVILQQMRNRLHLAHLGKKLMKWTALATGRELRRIAQELIKSYEDFGQLTAEAFLVLARSRYYYDDELNNIVLEGPEKEAALTVSSTIKAVSAGVRCLFYEVQDHNEPYLYLGMHRGGQTIQEAKIVWAKLLKSMVLIIELRTSFISIDSAHRGATKKKNVITKIIIPRLVATIKYITNELEELGREDNYRLKMVKKVKLRKAGNKTETKKTEICSSCGIEYTPTVIGDNLCAACTVCVEEPAADEMIEAREPETEEETKSSPDFTPPITPIKEPITFECKCKSVTPTKTPSQKSQSKIQNKQPSPDVKSDLIPSFTLKPLLSPVSEPTTGCKCKSATPKAICCNKKPSSDVKSDSTHPISPTIEPITSNCKCEPKITVPVCVCKPSVLPNKTPCQNCQKSQTKIATKTIICTCKKQPSLAGKSDVIPPSTLPSLNSPVSEPSTGCKCKSATPKAICCNKKPSYDVKSDSTPPITPIIEPITSQCKCEPKITVPVCVCKPSVLRTKAICRNKQPSPDVKSDLIPPITLIPLDSPVSESTTRCKCKSATPTVLPTKTPSQKSLVKMASEATCRTFKQPSPVVKSDLIPPITLIPLDSPVREPCCKQAANSDEITKVCGPCNEQTESSPNVKSYLTPPISPCTDRPVTHPIIIGHKSKSATPTKTPSQASQLKNASPKSSPCRIKKYKDTMIQTCKQKPEQQSSLTLDECIEKTVKITKFINYDGSVVEEKTIITKSKNVTDTESLSYDTLEDESNLSSKAPSSTSCTCKKQKTSKCSAKTPGKNKLSDSASDQGKSSSQMYDPKMRCCLSDNEITTGKHQESNISYSQFKSETFKMARKKLNATHSHNNSDGSSKPGNSTERCCKKNKDSVIQNCLVDITYFNKSSNNVLDDTSSSLALDIAIGLDSQAWSNDNTACKKTFSPNNSKNHNFVHSNHTLINKEFKTSSEKVVNDEQETTESKRIKTKSNSCIKSRSKLKIEQSNDYRKKTKENNEETENNGLDRKVQSDIIFSCERLLESNTPNLSKSLCYMKQGLLICKNCLMELSGYPRPKKDLSKISPDCKYCQIKLSVTKNNSTQDSGSK